MKKSFSWYIFHVFSDEQFCATLLRLGKLYCFSDCSQTGVGSQKVHKVENVKGVGGQKKPKT